MQKGAEAVHAVNRDVFVILSGLSFNTNLSFLLNRPMNLTFKGKLVFEVHSYGFFDGSTWITGNPNQVCGQVVDQMMRKGGFLLDQGYPFLMSEFGVDLRGTNENDNRYLNCILGVAAKLDLDWALWTLAGRVIGSKEFFGVYNWNWCEARNSSFLERISAVQSPFQGPIQSGTKLHRGIFHPLTGQCVQRKSLFEPLKIGPCTDSEAWTYNTQQKTLNIKGTYFYLQANGLNKPVKLVGSTSKWEPISDSKMHLSSKLAADGDAICLGVDSSSNIIITNTCKCLNSDNKFNSVFCSTSLFVPNSALVFVLNLVTNASASYAHETMLPSGNFSNHVKPKSPRLRPQFFLLLRLAPLRDLREPEDPSSASVYQGFESGVDLSPNVNLRASHSLPVFCPSIADCGKSSLCAIASN
ncbi:hypothetical protein HYC85_021209 [Camellia sinensis]|uniref:Glycoside hydrolase family 5 domain-containing protein n=1 Tax=Camellia sinensis TaxID=4442 RepID=A0A7J7GGZ9_CAMSI|nr:hypothetical protein HYC85_021209 [Camellia sinensis]